MRFSKLVLIFGELYVLYFCRHNEKKIRLNTTQILELKSLSSINIFSSEYWSGKELRSSGKLTSYKMKRLFDKCLYELLDEANWNLTAYEYRKIIKRGLYRFRKQDYDTREVLAIVDEFENISKIIGIDSRENFKVWKYGRFNMKLMKILKKIGQKI